MRRILTLFLALTLLLPGLAIGQSSPFPYSTTVTLQNAVAATGNGAVIPTNYGAITAIQASGTFTATGTFQGTVDGTNYRTITCFTPAGAAATTFTAAGLWYCRTQGLTGVRVPITWSSGTSVTVVANATSGTSLPFDQATGVVAPSGFAITNGATGTGTQIKATQTTVPTCSSNCGSTGTPVVVGSDSGGIITLGTGTMNAAPVMTFDGTWAAAPACVATQITTAANYVVKALSTTTTLTITLAATATASDKIAFICQGVAQ